MDSEHLGAGDPEPPGRFLQIAEREVGRIILDIHDGPVQNIFAALSQLYVLQRRLSRSLAEGSDEQERVRRSIALLEHALNEIRTFMGAFRPPEFERRDLIAVVEGLLIQHEELTGNPVNLEIEGPLPPVPLPVKIGLYRILQEALANAVRHGGAGRHQVLISGGPRQVRMAVADEGRGFDVAEVLRRPPGRQFGLAGMRERVSLLGGSLSIESEPGRGTVVRVEVPV